MRPLFIGSVIALGLACSVTATAATSLADAQRMFDAEQWEPAAIALDEVARTTAGTDREIAQYELAIALVRSLLPSAAYAIFGDIADHPGHARWGETLVWLARLALELPEPADVIERVGKYEPARIAASAARSPETASELAWLLGRYQYRNAQYAAALQTFEGIGRDSKRWVRGRFFCAAANVQLRRGAPALACLEAAASATDPARTPRAEDAALRDLAELSIARTLYSDSFRIDQGMPAIDSAKLQRAIDAWSAIDRTSPLFADALEEQAWALYMQRDDARALGNLHTLEAPYFSGRTFPEAALLRTLILLTNCQWEQATQTALLFQRTYLPIVDALGRLLTRVSGDDGDARVLELVAKHPLAPGDPASATLAALLDEAPVVRELGYVQFLDAERARFDARGQALRRSSLGGTIEDVLELARALAVRNLGDLVRLRLRERRDELEQKLRTSAAVVVDMPSLLAEGAAAPGIASGGAPKPITIDREHVKWPFDGEYWRDELGFYRESVTSRCGR